MIARNRTRDSVFAMLLSILAGLAVAKLPPPTPAQAEAQAAKKAQADAAAAAASQKLLAAQDALSARWRGKAASSGWKINSPTPVAAPIAAVMAPARESGPAGQPGGERGPAGAAAPMRSEKQGTAPPSKDVKKAPSPGPLPAQRRN